MFAAQREIAAGVLQINCLRVVPNSVLPCLGFIAKTQCKRQDDISSDKKSRSWIQEHGQSM